MMTTIEKFRKEKGLSQAEFGTIAGVTQGAVSLWEDAENPSSPHHTKAQKLISHFKGELTWDMIYGQPIEQQAAQAG